MDARAYLDRDWAALRTRKEEHWAREYAERGPEATLAAAAALWRHMRAVRPDWPTDAERADDLAHHIALKRLIDQAAGVVAAVSRR